MRRGLGLERNSRDRMTRKMESETLCIFFSFCRVKNCPHKNLVNLEPIMDQIVLIIATKLPYFYVDNFSRNQIKKIIFTNVSDPCDGMIYTVPPPLVPRGLHIRITLLV